MTNLNATLSILRKLVLDDPDGAQVALWYLQAHLAADPDEARRGALLEILRRLALVDNGELEPVTLTAGVDWRHPFETVWYSLGDGWEVAVFWDAGGWDYVEAIRTPAGVAIEVDPVDVWIDPAQKLVFEWTPSRNEEVWSRPTPSEVMEDVTQALGDYTQQARRGAQAMDGLALAFQGMVRAAGALWRVGSGTRNTEIDQATERAVGQGEDAQQFVLHIHNGSKSVAATFSSGTTTIGAGQEDS